MKKKLLVSYLLTKFDKLDTLNIFKKNYLKYRSGYDHDLLICFKLLDIKEIDLFKKDLDGLSYIPFVDYEKKNDHDFGIQG